MSVKAKYDPLLFKFPKGAICKNQKVNFHIEYLDEKEPKHVYFMIKKDEDNDYQYLEIDIYPFMNDTAILEIELCHADTSPIL